MLRVICNANKEAFFTVPSAGKVGAAEHDPNPHLLKHLCQIRLNRTEQGTRSRRETKQKRLNRSQPGNRGQGRERAETPQLDHNQGTGAR